MSLIHEYLQKMQQESLSILDLQQELSTQLSIIDEAWDCHSFVYAAAMNKEAPGLGMNADDFHVIHDMFKGAQKDRVLFYLQTPGGCGQTAERIAKFLHDKFKEVHFLIAGDAMSAGTILALSGHEILMTEGGSLGPIDAQMHIGRSWCSAHDYITWMEKIRKDVATNGGVHPVDATVLAQISPGELQSVHTALNFAIDRVERWLAEYKFRDWTTTETRGVEVTPEQRKKRAREIAKELTNQQKWHSHGTRLTIKDLEELNLKILKVEQQPGIVEPVERVKALLWIIFNNSIIFKQYADATRRINRQASAAQQAPQPKNAELIEMDIKCQQCGKVHRLIARFDDNPTTRGILETNPRKRFPSNNKLTCDCGFVIDLTGERAHIESVTGKRILDDNPQGGPHGQQKDQ